MGSRFLKAAVVLVSLAVIASCGGGGGGGQAQIRFVNASPNEGAVKFLVDGTVVANNLGYGASSGYQGVTSGSHKIQINLVGTSTGIKSTSVNVSGGSNYTLMMDNFASSLGAKQFTDSNTDTASGEFRIRFINESPSIGSVDVYLVAAGDSLAGQTPINGTSAIAFEGDTGYSSHAGGSYQIYFTPHGSTLPYIATGSLAFSAGQIRTIVALNSSGGGGYTYTTLKDLTN